MEKLLTEMDMKLFDALSQSSPNVYFYYADLKSFTARWSDSAVEYFGLPSNILNPASIWDERIHPDDIADYNENIAAIMSKKTRYHNCEYRIRNAQGEYVWVNCRGYVTYDKNGEPDFFAGMVTNMGQLSKVDQLTGLWTSYGLRTKVDQMLEKGIDGAVLLIDVRNFKQINAKYGYSFGDKVLYTIGNTLTETGGNPVYRVAGTQFAFCINGADSEDKVRVVYDKVKSAISEISIDGAAIHIEISSAATLFKRDGRFVDEIDNNISYAIASAKQKNIRDVVFYSKELVEERNRYLRLTEAIFESVENNCEGFRIVMQPIVDAETGKIHSAEALLRWHHKDFPNVGPMDFVPILEQSGKIIEVGKWVIDEALRCVSEWNSNAPAHRLQYVNINFSYIQFGDNTLKDYVVSKLDEYNLPHNILVAEVTESCRIEHTEEFAKELQKFRDEGISIALDDFGTGYASLMVLKDTPTDIVKLDHTMTRTIKNRPKDRSLVEFLIKYCREMDIDVCTEGVENEEIFGVVKSAGTSLMQGYYFDRPLETGSFYEKYIK